MDFKEDDKACCDVNVGRSGEKFGRGVRLNIRGDLPGLDDQRNGFFFLQLERSVVNEECPLSSCIV